MSKPKCPSLHPHRLAELQQDSPYKSACLQSFLPLIHFSMLPLKWIIYNNSQPCKSFILLSLVFQAFFHTANILPAYEFYLTYRWFLVYLQSPMFSAVHRGLLWEQKIGSHFKKKIWTWSHYHLHKILKCFSMPIKVIFKPGCLSNPSEVL